MALTNFGTLTNREVQAWSRDTWHDARNMSHVLSMMGSGPNNTFQRIKELRKSEKGAQAVITLVADLVDDGVMGDSTLEGNEEAINAYDIVIQMDQIRHANRNAGRMSDQEHVINFRKESKGVLSYWIADRFDQMALLTLSGIDYTFRNNGSLRPVKPAGQNLSDLKFAADVSAPTTGRHVRWQNSTGTLEAGDTTAVVPTDKVTYKSLVLLKARAKESYMKGVRGPNGREYYHVWLTPEGMAQLRLDQDYLENQRHAASRGDNNEIFKGAESVTVDGLIVHEHRHVFSTRGATAPNKWGAAGDVNGQRVLMTGAQSLGVADIGSPAWEEDDFDYKNQYGISIGKIAGLLKPKFHSIYTGQEEDFGVMVMDTSI